MNIVEEAGGKLVDPATEAPPFLWEGDGTDDVPPVFPVVKIVQGTSTMKDADNHIGEFWRSDVEEFYPELNIVPLFQRETRAMFMEGESLPACVSADGHVPLPDQPAWDGKVQPQACGDCPFSQWGEDPQGRPIAPKCRNSYLVLADHDGDLVQFRVSGMSIAPWRSFIARRVRPKNLRLCQFAVTLSTERRQDGGKKWSELRVEAERLPDELASQYNAVLAYERQRFVAGLHDATLAAE